MTPAHRTGELAELLCSNSLRSNEVRSAAGLLKEELRRLGSLLLATADRTRVAAGSALAVDRAAFAAAVSARIANHPNITVERCAVAELDWDRLTVVAAGPLISEPLALHLAGRLGLAQLHFYDAISPLVEAESVSAPPAFRASRYGKGSDAGDYLNLPLNRDEYLKFREALVAPAPLEPRPFENRKYFEACLPIEELARRGEDTMRFGPLKPVGLTDPRTGERPYAVVQLRQDDRAGTLYGLVGFQTRMQHGDQEAILRLLPGLAAARFARMGGMHRNTYFDLTAQMLPTLQLRQQPRVLFAGQLAGSEGYPEAMGLGWLAGTNAARLAAGKDPLTVPSNTALGSLVRYLTTPARSGLIPMHVNFGLLDPLPGGRKDEQRRQQVEAALTRIAELAAAADAA